MLSSREVEYILAVSKTKNITKAAEICHASQPALTIQLNSIENRLGFKIFDRSKGKVEITILGQKVVQICHEIDKKFDEMKSIHKSEVKVNIGIIPTIAPYLLPKIAKNLDNIGLNVFFYEYRTEELVEKIQNNEINYGILAYYKELVPNELKYTKLYDEELLFASQKAKKINIQEAVNNVIILNDGNCLNINITEICKMQNKKHTFAATSLEVVKAMILNGNGYGILPKNSVSNTELEHFNLQSFSPKAVREVGIVYKDSQYLDQITKIINFNA